MKAGSEGVFKQMSGMIDLKVETRGKLGPLADHNDSLQEGTRSRWEKLAKLLNVPACHCHQPQGISDRRRRIKDGLDWLRDLILSAVARA